ncbi:hypothetical protein NL676_016368 [Syzygium grande]|nr:hypothetical protein NL676_016368 [Syzygium grande]
MSPIAAGFEAHIRLRHFGSDLPPARCDSFSHGFWLPNLGFRWRDLWRHWSKNAQSRNASASATEAPKCPKPSLLAPIGGSRGHSGQGHEDENAHNERTSSRKRPRKCLLSLSMALLRQLSGDVTSMMQDGSRSPWEKKPWMKAKVL